MKTTLFILLYLFFIHTKAYSIEIEVDREEFSTGESVTAPIPVSPPIYLKVGNSNTLVFPADRNTYTFEIGIDPIAERFIGENFEGVKEWVGEGEMSIPDGFTETDFCWESISFISAYPFRNARQPRQYIPDTERTEPETPVGPPETAIWFDYTLKKYRDCSGDHIESLSYNTSTGYCTLILKDITGYAEQEGHFDILYTLQVRYGADTLVFDQTLQLTYRLTNRNYILEKVRNATNTGFYQSIVYYDGMGRSEQKILIGSSPDGRDIIMPLYYDSIGRNTRQYLPYAAVGGGKFQVNAFEAQDTFYTHRYGELPYAYSESCFDDEDRVVRSIKPGYAWRMEGEHTNRITYRKNTTADKVRKFVLTENSVTCSGYYPEGCLRVKEVVDSDNRVSLEYKNSEGDLIAEETRVSANESYFTYHIYDDLGRERYIFPPSRALAFPLYGICYLADLQTDCYYKEYDKYGREYKQYIPGAGYLIYLYDQRGRLSCTQNSKQREENKWFFTKYDDLDRPIMTGICTGTEANIWEILSHQKLGGEMRGETIHGYTNLTYPTNITEEDCLSITYYDDYVWPGQNLAEWSAEDALEGLYSEKIIGQITGTKIRVIGDSLVKWLIKANYYDQKYRTIQTVSQLYPGGIEINSTLYNFKGDAIQVKVKQVIGDLTTKYNKYLDYDNLSRLIGVRQKIGGDSLHTEVKLAEYNYDELGREVSYNFHNNFDSVRTHYHLNGKLSSVISSQFSYELDYEQEKMPGAVACYSGNINAIKWKHAREPERAYVYRYDPLNRFINAIFQEKTNSSWGNITGRYNVSQLSYDANGNITRLKRQGSDGSVLNDLIYHYSNPVNRNAISHITDEGINSSSYRYDNSGNMTFDGRREVNISYSLLNLPEKINKDFDNIFYIYDATGKKLAQRTGSSFTYYRNEMIYEGNDLSYIMHPKGFIRKSSKGFDYNYFLKDYLGNIRVVLEATTDSLAVVQRTDYYPYGLSFENYNLNRNKYLYSSKEFQDVSLSGRLLSMYDFGSRYYDPEIGRWFNIDPALQMSTPYGYCGNNPIMFVDPDGEFFWIPVVAFAAIGAYCGAATANDMEFNPLKWKFNGSTWAGLIGGGIMGGLQGLTMSYGLSIFNTANSFTRLGRILRITTLSLTSMQVIVTVGSMISDIENAATIFAGQYSFNTNNSFVEQVWQGVSRATWERIQQFGGNTLSHFRNMIGKVDKVTLFDGVVLVNNDKKGKQNGLTLGNYINSTNMKLEDNMFMHEYGHTIQSKRLGPLYISIGIFSLVSAASSSESDHDKRWYEMWANRLGYNYFNKHGDVSEWKFDKYPLRRKSK